MLTRIRAFRVKKYFLPWLKTTVSERIKLKQVSNLWLNTLLLECDRKKKINTINFRQDYKYKKELELLESYVVV